MFELNKVSNKLLWSMYWSDFLGSPVFEQQAYNATYPFIRIGDVLISRKYELACMYYLNKVEPPDFIKQSYNELRELLTVYLNNESSFGLYSMIKKHDNYYQQRLNKLKRYKQVAIIDDVVNNLNGFQGNTYVTYWSFGGTELIDSKNWLYLSVKMPVLCTRETLFTQIDKLSKVNWNNVIVFDERVINA